MGFDKQKIKVIQIAHASHSYFANEQDDLKKITLNDWYAKVAMQLRRFYPEIEVECWAPEKMEKIERDVSWDDVRFRFFPVLFSPCYALDFSPAMLWALEEEVKRAKTRRYRLIIHLHEYHNLHGLIIASLFSKEKLIAQHHGGSWPMKHLRNNKTYRWFFPFFVLGQLFEWFALKQIDCFYALAKDEINYLKKTAPNSKVRFQTMGIDDEYFKFVKRNVAREKLGLDMKKKILLYIGRIDSVKGIGFLLDAMNELNKKRGDIELKVVGYGKERSRFEDYAEKLGLKNVEFLGGVFGEKKMLYLTASNILVLPSMKEGAPVTLMEALARNLPVVVSDVGGVSLMIKDGREGRIIKRGSSKEIVNGIKDVLKCRKKDVKKYANKYKWREIIKKTVEEY